MSCEDKKNLKLKKEVLKRPREITTLYELCEALAGAVIVFIFGVYTCDRDYSIDSKWFHLFTKTTNRVY